jgi:hypothetical protein
MVYKPKGASVTPVTVWLDGTVVGEFTPDEAWRTFSFAAQSSPVSGKSSLRFTTATFNPARLHVSEDTRNLGFLIDWVRISVN